MRTNEQMIVELTDAEGMYGRWLNSAGRLRRFYVDGPPVAGRDEIVAFMDAQIEIANYCYLNAKHDITVFRENVRIEATRDKSQDRVQEKLGSLSELRCTDRLGMAIVEEIASDYSECRLKMPHHIGGETVTVDRETLQTIINVEGWWVWRLEPQPMGNFVPFPGVIGNLAGSIPTVDMESAHWRETVEKAKVAVDFYLGSTMVRVGSWRELEDGDMLGKFRLLPDDKGLREKNIMRFRHPREEIDVEMPVEAVKHWLVVLDFSVKRLVQTPTAKKRLEWAIANVDNLSIATADRERYGAPEDIILAAASRMLGLMTSHPEHHA